VVTEEKRPRVYRPNEVKAVYGLTRDLVFKEIAAGRLRSFRIGKARYVTAEAIEEYIRAREAEA
jgi:hypothetical protein